jgi:hypothetical protein
MWNNEVLLQVRVRLLQTTRVQPTYLDIHEIVDVDAPEFRKLKSTLLQESCDIITLLTLANQVSMVKNKVKRSTHHNAPPVATSIPVGIDDLDFLLFHLLLPLEPFLP